MPDKLKEILFNPNHEFSLKTLIILIVLALFTTYFGRWLAYRRQKKREARNAAAAKSGGTAVRTKKARKKKNPNKKK